METHYWQPKPYHLKNKRHTWQMKKKWIKIPSVVEKIERIDILWLKLKTQKLHGTWEV